MIHRIYISDEEFCKPDGDNSLMEFWAEKVHSPKRILCRCPKCWKTNKMAVDTAIVKLVNNSDEESYIVPLCYDCFEKKGDFDVYSPLVCISNLDKKII